MPDPAERGLVPRVVAVALLAVLALILLQQTADKIDAQMVKAGDAIWSGYALDLREDPQAPACDLDAAQAKLKTCVQPSAAPSGSDDPFGDADGDDPFADPFATAGDGATGPAGVPCPAAKALVTQCTAQHAAYEDALSRLTPAVLAWRFVEHIFRDLAKLALGLHLLSIVLLLGGIQATFLRTHIALKPARTIGEHRLSQASQLVAHLLMTASAYADWQVKIGLQMTVENAGIPLLWAVGFACLAAINLWHLLRPPPGLRPGGRIAAMLLVVPLYAWMMILAGGWFLLVEHHSSGQAIYLHKFAQIPSVYLAVALYVWTGMLLERTSLASRAFDLLRPWRLPVPLMAFVVVIAAALPTAYSGASGIFVIAAGALIFDELRQAGATPKQARLVTAMSGSLGVVLRPCLVVVLIASLNKEVTTDQLYHSGLSVFALTALVYLLVLVVIYRPKFTVAPVSEALPATLAAARRLVSPLLIAVALIAFYAYGLNAPLNERSAPWILPVLLILVLAWERWKTHRQPQAPKLPSVPASVFRATLVTGQHVGALLFLMAATVALGGVVERSELMALVPVTIGSPLLTMGILVVIMVLIGMTMDPMGAVILVSVTVADIAYRNGIDPVHFWMMVLVAFELGYLTPPVALNQLLTRQVVGDAADIVARPGEGFFSRHEHIIVPMVVMGISLLLVAFVPLFWG
ncbi:MAG: TRAP transporter large permease subunit [Oligoflexia bacterium]|nr:TRAP transporter large permease subunit [Oligoflexia bacterium]